jgi:hypothetical protein
MARPAEKEGGMSRSHGNKISDRPYTSSENFGIRDERSASRRRRPRPLAQTVEVLPDRFAEIVFDVATRQYTALGLRAPSRLQLIELLLDEWAWLRESPAQELAEDRAA